MYFFFWGGAGNYIPSVDVIWMKKIQRTKIAKTALYFDTGRICHFAWLTVGSPQISRLHPRKLLILKFICSKILGGGSGLALGLKVSGCHGEFGKKIKKFAPGVEHCGSTANVKKRRSRHLYKGEYGKSTQNGCFCKFCPW